MELKAGARQRIDATNNTVDLSVELNCPRGSECKKSLLDQNLNREVAPWSKTGGIDYDLFVQQRELANDHNVCYCTTANSDFTSSGCSCSGAGAEMSESNGGTCQTTANPINAPVATNCVLLKNTGTIAVINGPEDILLQWTYGQALVDAYQLAYGADKATIATYSGSDGAGHGVMLQHPLWTQQQISSTLGN